MLRNEDLIWFLFQNLIYGIRTILARNRMFSVRIYQLIHQEHQRSLIRSCFKKVFFKCSILTFAKTRTTSSVQLFFCINNREQIAHTSIWDDTYYEPANSLRITSKSYYSWIKICVTSFSGFVRLAHGDKFLHALHYTFYFRLTLLEFDLKAMLTF